MNNIEAKVPDALVDAITEMFAKPEIQEANTGVVRELVRADLERLLTDPNFLMVLGRFVAAKKKEVKKATETELTEPKTFENTGLYGIEDLENLADTELKNFVKAGIQVLRSELIVAIGQKEATRVLNGLAGQGIATVFDLLAYSPNELVSLIRNFGETHKKGIVQVLAKNKLRMKR